MEKLKKKTHSPPDSAVFSYGRDDHLGKPRFVAKTRQFDGEGFLSRERERVFGAFEGAHPDWPIYASSIITVGL